MIGIIGAMKTEVDTLREMLENPVSRVVSSVEFVSGRLCGRDAVIAKCGVGKVYAALCAQTMILEYGVSLIVNTGVAGALSKTLGIGDIAVSSHVVQHDMDTTALGEEPGIISGIDLVRIPASEKWGDIFLESADRLKIRAEKGVIASGDVFVASRSRKARIKKAFGACACEMEGAAVGQVCYINGVDFLVIRAISDAADGEAPESFPEFAQKAAQNAAKVIVMSLKNHPEAIV